MPLRIDMNMLSKTLIISATLLAPLLVSGCTSTKSQTIVEAEFLKIAEDSCKRAQKHDILEKLTNDAPSRVLVLAKKHAYKNYSAIWIDNKNVATVIYEYELSVCGPSYLVSMQKEANHDNSGDYEHSIKLNDDGTYTWTQHVPFEAAGVLESSVFTVKDGHFASTKAENPAYDRAFEYGPITGSDLQLLQNSVDAELIRIGEE
jgi:hypothetical protein